MGLGLFQELQTSNPNIAAFSNNSMSMHLLESHPSGMRFLLMHLMEVRPASYHLLSLLVTEKGDAFDIRSTSYRVNQICTLFLGDMAVEAGHLESEPSTYMTMHLLPRHATGGLTSRLSSTPALH